MNIDERLRGSGNIQPRRELRADFTQRITNQIVARPRRAWWQSPREIVMKLLDKPAMAIAGIVITLAISGTAYAAVVNWPNISAMFGGEQPTDAGRIVKVDVQNCHTDNAFTITKPKEERGSPRYFMVKKDSHLTNEQITEMVKGNCEQGAQSDVLLGNIQQHYQGDNVVGGYIDNEITAISANSITLEADIPIGETLTHVKKTFDRIDPNVAVYYKADKLQLSDLKVGDHVFYAYRATGDALAHSETLNPADLNTNETTIVMIVKNTPAATAAVNYQKHFGMDFEEVVPCDATESGYCNAREYYQNKAK